MTLLYVAKRCILCPERCFKHRFYKVAVSRDKNSMISDFVAHQTNVLYNVVDARPKRFFKHFQFLQLGTVQPFDRNRSDWLSCCWGPRRSCDWRIAEYDRKFPDVTRHHLSCFGLVHQSAWAIVYCCCNIFLVSWLEKIPRVV